uniref:RNA polymerase II subunit 5-mediating n=1 Tax=Sipha flava TaxID=143950 RepID=A0A2S2QMG6_9HEMI
MDNPQTTDFVQKINLEALQCNYSLEQKWKGQKREYEELHTCLEEFPKELSAPIMMPIGTKVFIRAQLCNTNEVFIRYDDIFTKQTAYEAKAVCKRQIKRCDDMIENLEKEKQFLSKNCSARQEIFSDSQSDELKEIVEPYDEEKEAEWKELHKQKVKEYKQQLAEEKNKNKITEKMSYEQLWNLCDLSKYASNEDDDSDDEDLDSNDIDDDFLDEDDDDDDDDDDDEDSKIEIVFTNDVPETTRNVKKKIKKRVSFNNDVQIKEFEARPEEHFIRRREETNNENENPKVCSILFDFFFFFFIYISLYFMLRF